MVSLFADWHTHTRFSHGKGSILDNVGMARKHGLSSIAITDHGPRNILVGSSEKKLLQLRELVDRYNELYDDIEILAGVEANVVDLDGNLDVSPYVLARLDIVLVGLHKWVMPGDLYTAIHFHLPNSLGIDYARLRRLNTEAITNAVKRYEVDIVTHPGLHINIDTRELARVCKERDTLLEINASHGYLTLEYIKIAREEGARFVINSDAHRPQDVGSLGAGIALVSEAGLTVGEIANAKED